MPVEHENGSNPSTIESAKTPTIVPMPITKEVKTQGGKLPGITIIDHDGRNKLYLWLRNLPRTDENDRERFAEDITRLYLGLKVKALIGPGITEGTQSPMDPAVEVGLYVQEEKRFQAGLFSNHNALLTMTQLKGVTPRILIHELSLARASIPTIIPKTPIMSL